MTDRIDPDRLLRMSELYTGAATQPPAARGDWLAARCADDPGLRAEVEELLDTDWPTLRLTPTGESLLAALAVLDDEQCPATLGGMPVIGRLGAGAMGTVYEVEQAEPRRRIAIKVMRTLLTASGRARFQSEIELLARLDHPNIARIHFAGRTESGLPFLAMERIDGPTLAEWTRGDHTLPERIALLQKLCAAVEHAHQRGVLHRDLKPSNVLVAAGDEPKVVDFGVARSVTSGDQGSITQDRELVGTLAYMSPEQLGGDLAGIDTRADVYSLGVIAYELLSGQLPYDLRGKSLTEIVRMLDHDEPVPLGQRRSALRGDLEAIVAAAMAKDREARYASASLLAADLERSQRHLPISVGHLSRLGLIGKWVRRHRGFAAGLAMTFLTLIGGLAVSLRAWDQATAAAAEALAEARAADDVAQRLQWILEIPAAAALPADIRFVDLLDLAAAQLQRAMDARPEVEARIRTALARAFQQVGRTDEAMAQMQRAAEVGADHLGPWIDRSKFLLVRLQVLAAAGQHAAVGAAAPQVVAVAASEEGPLGMTTVYARDLGIQSQIARGDLAGAEAAARALGHDVTATPAADPFARTLATLVLAEVLLAKGDNRGADALRHTLNGAEHTSVMSRNPFLRRRMDGLQSTLGAISAEVMATRTPRPSWRSLMQVGHSLLLIDDPARAERLLAEAFEQVAAIDPPDDTHLLKVAVLLARCLGKLGRHADAVRPFEVALAAAERAMLPDAAAMARFNLAMALVEAGRHAEAVQRSEGLEAHFAQPGRFMLQFELCHARGKAMTALGQFEEAERLLVRAVELATENGHAPGEVPELVALYEAWGRPEQAAKWRDGAR